MNDRADGDTAATAALPPTGNARRDTIPPDAPVVEASTLFGRHRQVVIGHNGCRYVPRITQHGKLILNK
jgi:hemin uptake protein HemP